MPEGRFGWPTLVELAEFKGRQQIHDVYEFFGSKIDSTVATAGDLPASGNWQGRHILALDTLIPYVWASGWKSTGLRVDGEIPRARTVLASDVVLSTTALFDVISVTLTNAPIGVYDLGFSLFIEYSTAETGNIEVLMNGASLIGGGKGLDSLGNNRTVLAWQDDGGFTNGSVQDLVFKVQILRSAGTRTIKAGSRASITFRSRS